MAENNVREALEELLDYLEQVETQSGAVLQVLRDMGMISDENFRPYLEKASNATSVKSRAIRARFDFLFTKDEAKPATEGVPAASSSNGNVMQATQQSPNAGGSKDKEAA